MEKQEQSQTQKTPQQKNPQQERGDSIIKRIRATTVTFIEEQIRKLGFTDEKVFIILRTVHHFGPLIAYYVLFFGSKTLVHMIIIYFVIIVILFKIFDGCILTHLENRFSNKYTTVVDPLLNILGLEINNENRRRVSIYTFFFNVLIILFVYKYRF